ncbi:uncharacterized protein LOC124257547 [Haliotis rubra]|uniref:uncharacterized protein LOC124257547 n=1 Tax=Haliotis rubra TaxID=36100 RepID=UPI001EE546FF|nr:uncharacterized protein LOC124257547 [Haliotis rubra]XP_046547601.1 uncharacterized protein LOC124257547 [Haliotis rubra]
MAGSETGGTSDSGSVRSQTREFTWADDTMALGVYKDHERLPKVVKLEEKGEGKLCPGLKIYSKQPVLFHARSSKTVASARTIHKDGETGMYFEVGQTLLLPEDYEGWFEMVPSDFGRATCFRSIAEVSEVMPRMFFTRSNIKAIRIQKQEDENQKIFERKIPAGSVLKVESIFTATWKTSAVTGVFKKSKTEWITTEVKYLKCIDSDQQEILVPLTQRGKFNALYERGNLNKNSVYRMKDILSDVPLPVKARLLFGKAPVVPCIFTGMMVIKAAEATETIISSTVLNKRNVLFEVPLTAPCDVTESADEEEYKDLDSYRDAKRLCRKYATLYSMMIKLSPEMDTNQQVIQHIPTSSTGNTLSLDLIGDISLTDDPVNVMMESDTDSVQSEDQSPVFTGMLLELKEFKNMESTTTV